jgi:hypothetical protein
VLINSKKDHSEVSKSQASSAIEDRPSTVTDDQDPKPHTPSALKSSQSVMLRFLNPAGKDISATPKEKVTPRQPDAKPVPLRAAIKKQSAKAISNEENIPPHHPNIGTPLSKADPKETTSTGQKKRPFCEISQNTD